MDEFSGTSRDLSEREREEAAKAARDRLNERIGSAVLTVVVLLVVSTVLVVLTDLAAAWCFALPALYGTVFRLFFVYTDGE